ncbi:Fungal Zn2-Cys6 binuclear cluster domain-containing protein [Cladophialophora immunda]|nr:Fungal Zn2-Cys6 binuclear cluster domain-containing protein [Cladophialophora immunda]
MRLHNDLIATGPARTTALGPPRSSDKRPSSLLGAEAERVVRRRASRACQACRAKKTRCDVTVAVSQCTNCRLDNIECVVPVSKRGRTQRARRSSVLENAENTSSHIRDGLGGLGLEAAENDFTTASSPLSPDDPALVPVSVTFDEELDKARSYQQPAESDADEDSIDRVVIEAHGDVVASEPETGMVASPSVRASLPGFIAKLPTRVTGEDLEFLVRKGAMTIPDRSARIEILRGYLYGVHPFMPMLDFHTLSQAVLHEREDLQISLLLFQAVMFAGLHPLKSDAIKQLGFESVKQAREVFFNRVRLLYEFDVEKDHAAILQSLLLMSNWYGKWDDRKHTWHWTGLAYDVARNMGLHREPTTKFGSESIRHFRRRLWWSLYIRDRLITLGTRRPMRIHDDDFDVAMLTLEDFDPREVAEPFQTPSMRLSVEENTAMALMCIQLAELCKHIGRVVSSQYTVLSSHPDTPYTMMVVSKCNVENPQELERCDRELEEWCQAQGGNTEGRGALAAPRDPNSCSGVYWTILNITYLTVLNVLHRAQALQTPSKSPDSRSTQILSRSKVKKTARILTESLRTMLRRDQVRFLGPVGVTALVAASLSHALDIRAQDPDVHDAVAWRLSQNLQVLQALSEIYASADAAISFLTTITQRAGGRVPAPALEPFVANRIGNRSPARRRRSTDQPDRRTTLHPANMQARPCPTPTEGYNQQGDSPGLLLKNRQHPHPRGMATPGFDLPPAEAFPASNTSAMFGYEAADMARDGLMSGQYLDEIRHSIFGDASSSATQGALGDWTYDAEAGFDVDAMTFNYDFYAGTSWAP